VTFWAEPANGGRFSLGNKTLANGKASVTTSGLPKGVVRLVVEYPDQMVPGQGDLNGGSDRTTYTIT